MKKIFLCLLGVSLLIGITGCGTSDSLNGKWIATTENQNIYQVNEDGDELGGKEDYILECDGNGNYTLTLENNQTKKGTYTILEDTNSISISHGSYRITSMFNENKITVYKSIPLSQGHYLDYNTNHKEIIEKVLKVLIKENLEGFYDNMITRIKNEFNLI